MYFEETLNVISQLQRTKTNIFSICIQEIIGFGKYKTILEGKYIRDIKENKDFVKFKFYHTEGVNFLSGKCYIYIINSELLY